jgi:ribosomal protein S18 acetylase RimI-like enzyme
MDDLVNLVEVKKGRWNHSMNVTEFQQWVKDYYKMRDWSDLDIFIRIGFLAEETGEIIGFLIGFLSQSRMNKAYIHFVGVHPEYRGKKIGKQLYSHFFDVTKQNGRNTIRCVTSPVNKASIAYHTNMGFKIEQGDKELNNISVHTNYDGVNQDCVLFVKHLV